MMRGWTYYETVTRDDLGETVEGDHGIYTPEGEYVSFANVHGDQAVNLHHAHAYVFDLAEMLDGRQAVADWIVETLGGYDHIDDRGDEAIVYGAHVGPVDDDEPYIRSVAIEGCREDVAAVLDLIR